MDSKVFKTYKPQAYQYLKSDYGIIESDDDDDTDFSLPPFEEILLRNFPPATHIVSDTTVDTPNASSSTGDCMMTNMKSMFQTMKNEVVSEINRKKASINVSSSFRCVICFESKISKFMACYHCGRFLGCETCISKVDKCPLCRKAFQCISCGEAYPRTAFFIPGLAETVEISDDSNDRNEEDTD